VTLMPKDLPLLQRRPLRGRVFPWVKPQVTRLDLLLLQPRLVCEPASLWAKPRVRQPVKAMRRSQLPRLSSRLSYAPDVSLALALVIRPDWATDLAQYKLWRSRLHKAEKIFVVIMIIVNRPQNYSQHIPSGNDSARIVLANCPWWVGMNECAARAWLGPCPPARETAAPALSEPVVCATLCPVDLTLGCLKWAAVGFVVAFALLKLFEASHLHDDIPKPAFKLRQTKRATLVLSTFAAMLSALVWLLVQKLD